eukprot:8534488-Pyramimonas_sp.AAC.1
MPRGHPTTSQDEKPVPGKWSGPLLKQWRSVWAYLLGPPDNLLRTVCGFYEKCSQSTSGWDCPVLVHRAFALRT